MRPTPTTASRTALLVLLALLSSCGNGDEDDLRISIRCLSMDGELPAGLRATNVSPDGRKLGEYDVVPVEGGRRAEYRVVGGPEGSYLIEGPEDWWMLQTGQALPMLQRKMTPAEAVLGRGRSLYLASATATLRPGRVWGAERILPDGTRKKVPVGFDPDADEYTIALRFAAEDWTDEIEVVGHVALGMPDSSGSDAPLGPLASIIRIVAPENGAPVVRQVSQAPHRALDVVLVAASDEVSTDGMEVVVAVDGLPIEVTHRAVSKNGVARFPRVAGLKPVLRVMLPSANQTFLYDRDSWHRSVNLRLLVTGDRPLRAVDTTVPSDSPVDLVLVRPKAAPAFARVPFERREGSPSHVHFRTTSGPFVALLRSGSRWAEIESGGDGDLALPEPTFEEGVIFEGRVDGRLTGAVVRFFRVMDEEAVLGDGFSLRISPSATYRGYFPTGTYLVETASPHGQRRREGRLVAEEPGASIHLPLTAP